MAHIEPIPTDSPLLIDARTNCAFDVVGPLFDIAGVMTYHLPRHFAAPSFDPSLWALAMSACVGVSSEGRVVGLVRQVRVGKHEIIVEIAVTRTSINEISAYMAARKQLVSNDDIPLPSIAMQRTARDMPLMVLIGDQLKAVKPPSYSHYDATFPLSEVDARTLRQTRKAVPGIFARMPVFAVANNKEGEMCVTKCLGYVLNLDIKEVKEAKGAKAADKAAQDANGPAEKLPKVFQATFQLVVQKIPSFSIVVRRMSQRINTEKEGVVSERTLDIPLVVVDDLENTPAPPWAHNLDKVHVEHHAYDKKPEKPTGEVQGRATAENAVPETAPPADPAADVQRNTNSSYDVSNMGTFIEPTTYLLAPVEHLSLTD